jgi:hypothetical protein
MISLTEDCLGDLAHEVHRRGRTIDYDLDNEQGKRSGVSAERYIHARFPAWLQSGHLRGAWGRCALPARLRGFVNGTPSSLFGLLVENLRRWLGRRRLLRFGPGPVALFATVPGGIPR